MTLAIDAEEHAARRARLLEHCAAAGLAGYVLSDPDYVRYFFGFAYLFTERPVLVAQSTAGEQMVFVPGFEVDRVREETRFERVVSYPEYPGLEHPIHALARALAELGVRGALGADNDGYPGVLGYTGPALSTVTGATVAPLGEVIEAMLMRKSPAEIALLRESGRWCAYAHGLLQEYSVPGASEAEAGLRAGHEATLAMLAEHGETGGLGSADIVKAGYRGQIGRRSAWAHAVGHNIRFRPGDVLVSETGAPFHGYNAELERAMVIGTPNAEQRRLFEYMLDARQAALDALRPGATCAEVDGAVMRHLDEHGLRGYWQQHTGHAVGLRNHEAPFLDIGDHTVIEPGMVFTIEPGIYDPAVGGFRHSDTVAVTEHGIDLLTDYPVELDALVIAA